MKANIFKLNRGLKIMLGLLFLLANASAIAQEVERNYEMGPQITDCDRLDINGMSQIKQIEHIEKTKFRLVKNFALNRKTGFQGAWFYSCDSQAGYLVVKVDGLKKIYGIISLEIWQEFLDSGDFENFIEQHFAIE